MRSVSVLILMTYLSFAQTKHSYVPKEGFVPDEKTAIRIAEAVLVPIYGEGSVIKQRPFKAHFMGGIWLVEGTLPAGVDGGVAMVEVRKLDGRIVRVSHGK